jgi:hypothetical protein
MTGKQHARSARTGFASRTRYHEIGHEVCAEEGCARPTYVTFRLEHTQNTDGGGARA